jgi:hypothetical protein
MTRLHADELVLPAADLGDENPLAPLHRVRELHEVENLAELPPDMRERVAYGRLATTLPCLTQDGYGRDRTPRALPVLVLENEHLRATVLPGFGGRLYSLLHKGSGRELLYRNPVWQPANLALRNAWFAGGVEWNLGSTGHTTLTCEPLHAARVTGPDGAPMLRLWEWERTRDLVQQVDMWLPEDSPLLYVGVRVRNPNPVEVPAYWWSNVAVPQSPGTRVVVPADRAWHYGYGRRLELVDVPLYDGVDLTYPMRHRASSDFFFDLPAGQRPWITALDESGAGLLQASTARLRGRKLFVWGEARGGRRWQEWLAGGAGGDGYTEIQAGLAPTQMEHLRLPARTEWDWLEAYGLLEVPADAAHDADWAGARDAVGAAVERLLPGRALDERHAAWRRVADDEPGDRLAAGSGWGALELRRAARTDEHPDLRGTPFDDRTLTTRQDPWLALLDGALPPVDPGSPPDGTPVGPGWSELLEAAGDDWLSAYHRGVARWCRGDAAGAVTAWRQSVADTPTLWALRNLAVAACADDRAADAAARYREAIALAPDLSALAVEALEALLALDLTEDAAAVLAELPEAVRAGGRVRLAEVRIRLATGDASGAAVILDDGVELADLREGAADLADAWESVQRALGTDRPVPAEYDFRTKA